jgi:hypothetical protein
MFDAFIFLLKLVTFSSKVVLLVNGRLYNLSYSGINFLILSNSSYFFLLIIYMNVIKNNTKSKSQILLYNYNITLKYFYLFFSNFLILKASSGTGRTKSKSFYTSTLFIFLNKN